MIRKRLRGDARALSDVLVTIAKIGALIGALPCADDLRQRFHSESTYGTDMVSPDAVQNRLAILLSITLSCRTCCRSLASALGLIAYFVLKG